MAQEEFEPKPKISFVKRYWLIFIIAIVVLAGGFIVISNIQGQKNEEQKQSQKDKQKADETNNQEYVYEDPVMNTEQLATATTALQSGISIDDPANDFAQVAEAPKGLDGKNDNTKPYQLNWNDVKKVTIGADNENFYIRYDYYGAIPGNMVTVGGDDIKTLSCNVGLAKFISNSGQQNEGMFQVGVQFTEQRGKDSKDESLGYDALAKPRMGLTSIASPSSQLDKYGETEYAIQSQNGTVFGGIGSDYIIAAFPLANLDIKPGSEMTFDISVETNSRIYHHSSIDPILDYGSTKTGMQITYNLGSNSYTSKIPQL